MKRSRESTTSSQGAPQADNGPPEKQRRTPRGRPRKTPSPVECQDGPQKEAPGTPEPVTARGTGTRRGRGRPRRGSASSIGGSDDNGCENEGGEDVDIPTIPEKLPSVKETEEPSAGADRPGSRTRGRARNASTTDAQDQSTRTGGSTQQRRSSRKKGSPAPVEDTESTPAAASTMLVDNVGRQAEAPPEEAAPVENSAADDMTDEKGAGHGGGSTPPSDPAGLPGMLRACAESIGSVGDSISMQPDGAAATSGASEPVSVSVEIMAVGAVWRERILLETQPVLGGAEAMEVATGGQHLEQGDNRHAKADGTTPTTGSPSSAAAMPDTTAPHGLSQHAKSVGEVPQAESESARAAEQEAEQVAKEVTSAPEGPCSPLTPSAVPAPSPSKAHVGAAGSTVLSRQKRPFLPMSSSTAPGLLPTRDSVTSLPTRSTGLPARSAKWGDTSLGLRSSMLGSAPSSLAPSTLLSRPKHENGDVVHEAGTSDIKHDKQPPVPSIGFVSSPLKLSALDPPSASLPQSLPKPDFKIPRSGVDKKTQLAGAQEKLRATVARSSVLQHAKHETHVQEPIDKEASFIASHIKEWHVYNDEDHQIPEARAPREVPLLEKDWQKYAIGKSDQPHSWWGVNLSASDR